MFRTHRDGVDMISLGESFLVKILLIIIKIYSSIFRAFRKQTFSSSTLRLNFMTFYFEQKHFNASFFIFGKKGCENGKPIEVCFKIP